MGAAFTWLIVLPIKGKAAGGAPGVRSHRTQPSRMDARVDARGAGVGKGGGGGRLTWS